MPKRIKIPRKFTIFLVLIVLIVITILLLRQAGNFLIRKDKLYHADALILLMGNFPERILHAADLYKQGVAGKLIFSEESNGALQLLKNRGVDVKSSNEQCLISAIALGIPGDSITVLPSNAQSTQMEAIIVRNYLVINPDIDTLVLVTSPSHTRRAGMIFEKAVSGLDHDVVIYTSPSTYSDFTGEKWWRDREDIQQVVFEYIKIVNFLLVEQWEL